MTVVEKNSHREKMIEWMRAILEPGQITELRAVKIPGRNKPHQELGFFDYEHIPQMVDQAIKLTLRKPEGIYVMLNPLNPAILHRRRNRVDFAAADDGAADKDVMRRRWMLIDCDPIKADRKVSSSNQEKELAEMLAMEVKEWLSSRGWPDPIEADSGNGSHLLYRIDEAAADDSLVKSCLEALSERFKRTDVKVDTVPGNAARICKFYGTMARKGDHSDERPHRKSKVDVIPESMGIVTTVQLKDLAATLQVMPKTTPTPQRHDGQRTSLRGLSPIERARKYVAYIDPAVEGEQGHNQTWHCVMVLIDGFGLSVADAKPILEEWNQKCVPPWSESELMHKLTGAEEHRSINAGYLLGNDEPWSGPTSVTFDLESFGIVADVKPAPVPTSTTAANRGFSLNLISSEELSAKDFTQRFLINGILVANQPCIIGGKSKTLKTSIAIDLAFALGSGTRFLGEFNVPESVPVMVLSGESGGFTIQETARRIADRRGWPLGSANVLWGFDLPQLSRGDHLMVLEEGIRTNGIKCAIIDPAYLCLMGGDTQGRQASNVFDMGSLLQPLGDIGRRNKCTICLIHHHKKGGQFGKDPNAMPELEDLAFAGFTEWARQWLLIGRRSTYDTEKGLHELWLNVGGSAGHHGTWAVDIDEGVVDEEFKGRFWKPTVRRASEAVALKEERTQVAKTEERRERVLDLLRKKGHAMTPRQIRDLITPSVNQSAMASILDDLRECGLIMPTEVVRNKRKEEGWVISPRD